MIRLIIIKIIGCFHNFGHFFFFFFWGGGGVVVNKLWINVCFSETYPSPNLTFRPKRGASVNAKFGEG